MSSENNPETAKIFFTRHLFWRILFFVLLPTSFLPFTEISTAGIKISHDQMIWLGQMCIPVLVYFILSFLFYSRYLIIFPNSVALMAEIYLLIVYLNPAQPKTGLHQNEFPYVIAAAYAVGLFCVWLIIKIIKRTIAKIHHST